MEGLHSCKSDSDILRNINNLNECSGKTQNKTNFKNFGVEDINIADYVQSLPACVRNKIARFVGTGLIDQEMIDLENMQHYLVVSRHSNPLRFACESKLLSQLTSENCLDFLQLSDRFNLTFLRKNAQQVLENNVLNNNNITSITSDLESSGSIKTYRRYQALFTCSTTNSTRKITVTVLDSEQNVQCYRKIKKSNNISNQLQCCCIQNNEGDPPYVYWSFGRTFCRYDPILNKYKKLQQLQFSRSNFSMVAVRDKCYAIGGMYKGQYVGQIEEYDVKRKSWKTVANVPVDGHMSFSSSVKFDDVIYIFTSATNTEDQSLQKTCVYSFDPKTKAVNFHLEIPLAFDCITGCTAGSNIYIASENGDFVRYQPENNCYEICCRQLFKCKGFGMYERDGNIYLLGGMNVDGKYNDTIRKYCSANGQWKITDKKLPDVMTICDTCEVKIPSSCSVVPFYETKFFEMTSQ